MIMIAICDDDTTFGTHLSNQVNSFFSESNNAFSIQVFTNGRQLLLSDTVFDLYLLDIRMPELSGTELADMLRHSSESKESSIIFVTSMHDAVYDSFRYSPLRFIRKEMADQELGEALTAFLKHRELQKCDALIEVNENGISRSLSTKDILFVEIRGHYLDFVCTQQTLHVRGKIAAYEKLLSEYHFSRCHQSFLVNLSSVKFINSTSVILYNGQEVAVSRSYRENFKKEYMKWRRDEQHVLTI